MSNSRDRNDGRKLFRIHGGAASQATTSLHWSYDGADKYGPVFWLNCRWRGCRPVAQGRGRPHSRAPAR